jgi:hypothetical protein
MSLVIGFSGSGGAIIAGDLRELLLWGEEERIRELERELYGGKIIGDQQLKNRASDLGVSLSIRDTKEKIRERDDVLIGEVTESDGAVVRKRRLYLVPGEYAIADIEGHRFHVRSRGEKSSFIVLGNEVTKMVAQEAIDANWKNGTFEDAVEVIVTAMETAASRTASVSDKFLVLQTKKKVSLSGIMEKDRLEIETGRYRKQMWNGGCDGLLNPKIYLIVDQFFPRIIEHHIRNRSPEKAAMEALVRYRDMGYQTIRRLPLDQQEENRKLLEDAFSSSVRQLEEFHGREAGRERKGAPSDADVS